jgi:hypothetical protein
MKADRGRPTTAHRPFTFEATPFSNLQSRAYQQLRAPSQEYGHTQTADRRLPSTDLFKRTDTLSWTFPDGRLRS